MKPYYAVVAELLNKNKPKSILDAPSGNGWLKEVINYEADIDGLDLFADTPVKSYRNFRAADLDRGLPSDLGEYDAIVCCEGIEHFGNPELFFRTSKEHLSVNGLLIITTPNTWNPASKLQFLIRGFFPSFPCLVGSIKRGTHMHITPWSFAQLYLYLKLNGYKQITLHEINEPKPKRLFEYLFGWPQLIYCKSKLMKAKTEEEKKFWEMAGSRQSLFGRRLAVSAIV